MRARVFIRGFGPPDAAMYNAALPEHQVSAPLAHAFSNITSELADHGWAVVDDFVPHEWAAELLEEQQQLFRRGGFRQAGIGRKGDYQLDKQERGDHILWLDHGNSLPAQQQYLTRLEELRRAVNGDLFLGLYESETHAAIYPPGSFYRRHLDGFQLGNRRTLTAILYLNPRWHAEDGGALRLYLDPKPGNRFIDVEPRAGRLVTFLSEQFPHEVLVTRRERSSITSWFSRRQLQ